jgi:hypothetical protein
VESRLSSSQRREFNVDAFIFSVRRTFRAMSVGKRTLKKTVGVVRNAAAQKARDSYFDASRNCEGLAATPLRRFATKLFVEWSPEWNRITNPHPAPC